MHRTPYALLIGPNTIMKSLFMPPFYWCGLVHVDIYHNIFIAFGLQLASNYLHYDKLHLFLLCYARLLSPSATLVCLGLAAMVTAKTAY